MRFLPRSSICLLSVIVAILFSGTVLGATPELPKGLVMNDTFKPGYGAPIGKFRTVQGKVVVMHADKKEGYWAKKNQPLYKGDVIVTQKKSRANFVMNDKSIISLSSNTELILTKSVYDDKKKRRSSFLGLTLGKARFVVSKLLSFKRREFKVKTVTAVCGVRGSKFIIEATFDDTVVTAEDETTLAVYGVADPEAAPVIVKDYQRTGVELGQVPYAAVAVPLEEVEMLKKDFAASAKEDMPEEDADVKKEESSDEDTAGDETGEEGTDGEDAAADETEEEGAAEEDSTADETGEEGADEEDAATEETGEEGTAEEDAAGEDAQEEGAAEEDTATEDTQEGEAAEEEATSEQAQADESAASDTEAEETQTGEPAESDAASGETQPDEPAAEETQATESQTSDSAGDTTLTDDVEVEKEDTGDQDFGDTIADGMGATGKTVDGMSGEDDTATDAAMDQEITGDAASEGDVATAATDMGQAGDTVAVETEGGVDPGALYVPVESLVEPEVPTEFDLPVVDIEDIIVDVVEQPEIAEQVAEQILQEDLEIPPLPGTPE